MKVTMLQTAKNIRIHTRTRTRTRTHKCLQPSYLRKTKKENATQPLQERLVVN